MIISPPPADLRGERKKARMHFAVIRLPYGNSSCGKKRGCVATASADEVPAYSGAERHRWQMELDLALLAGFRHAPVQRTAPANARDFPQVLAATLRSLEHEGLICRTVYAEIPPQVEYRISSHGETVRPLIRAVRAWGREHLEWKRRISGPAPGDGGKLTALVQRNRRKEPS